MCLRVMRCKWYTWIKYSDYFVCIFGKELGRFVYFIVAQISINFNKPLFKLGCGWFGGGSF